MGLNFRKSIKIGKNTRINFSKTGGIGISTGTKGARVSINKKGVRTSVGTGGIRYTKSVSFKNNKSDKGEIPIKQDASQPRKPIIKTMNENNRMVQNHTEEEIKEFRKTHYTRHMKLLFAGLVCLIAGIIFPPILVLAVILLFLSLACMIKNWKRINSEYKVRINK
jgi:hypothetical protein